MVDSLVKQASDYTALYNLIHGISGPKLAEPTINPATITWL